VTGTFWKGELTRKANARLAGIDELDHADRARRMVGVLGKGQSSKKAKRAEGLGLHDRCTVSLHVIDARSKRKAGGDLGFLWI